MFKKIILILILVLPIIMVNTTAVFAHEDYPSETPSATPTTNPTIMPTVVSTPGFPSCSNPQGDVIASYEDGTHGIIGLSNMDGKDTVYKVNENQVLQCFCGENGQGIQTNWFKTNTPENYPNWISVSNGAGWGLENTSYVAQNSNYVCNVTPTPVPSEITETPTAGPTETPTPGSSNNSNSSSSSSSNNSSSSNTSSSPAQTVAAALAFTGNEPLIYAFILAGAASLISGMVLKRLSK